MSMRTVDEWEKFIRTTIGKPTGKVAAIYTREEFHTFGFKEPAYLEACDKVFIWVDKQNNEYGPVSP